MDSKNKVMLKKTQTKDIRLGMYIHDLCGDWMDHPFWKKSFKLTEQTDLDTLLNSSLEEVLIDTSKGLDVEASAPKILQPEDKPEPQEAAKPPKKQLKVSFQEEIGAARKIHAKTKEAVVSIFSEARMGNAIEVEGAVLLVDEISQSVARNSDALLSLIRLKNADEYTYLHSVAVCTLMVALGRQLGLEGDLLKQAGVAGLFHDIGKMAIPGKVLNKPGARALDG